MNNSIIKEDSNADDVLSEIISDENSKKFNRESLILIRNQTNISFNNVTVFGRDFSQNGAFL